MAAMLRLMELADYAVPFALRAVATHGIADHLAGGPRPAHALAGPTGLDADALERLLRALTCKDVLTEEEPGHFALTPAAHLLRTDHPGSAREDLRLRPDHVLAWADAGRAVQEGRPAFDRVRPADGPPDRSVADRPGAGRTGAGGADQADGRAGGVATLSPATVDPARARLRELADYTVPTMIRALSELGIADLLAAGPRPVTALADDLGADAPTLLVALRAVARHGVFTEVAPEEFATTDLADLMRTDLPHSLQGCLPLMQADLRAWAGLEHTLRTGEPAFPHVHGESYYEYLARRPVENARFDSSQQGATRLELRAALRGYDWGGAGTLVDVGGGNGTFLAGVLGRHPGLRGVLFDLPFVSALSTDVLAGAGVADRCTVVGGSFFDDPVPPGHDTYLLKRTLYNWDDASAVRILRAVRAAMRPDSRLLLFEPTRRPGDTFDVARLTDVLMLVFTGGALRTIDRIGALMAQADLRVHRLVPTPMFPILEAGPA